MQLRKSVCEKFLFISVEQLSLFVTSVFCKMSSQTFLAEEPTLSDFRKRCLVLVTVKTERWIKWDTEARTKSGFLTALNDGLTKRLTVYRVWLNPESPVTFGLNTWIYEGAV